MPHPIASGMKRYDLIQEERYSERARALLKLFEVTLKYVTALAAKSRLAAGDHSKAMEEHLDAMVRSSIGNWAGLLARSLRTKARAEPESDPLLADLVAWHQRDIAGDRVANAVADLCAAARIQQPGGNLTNARLIDVLVQYRNRDAHGNRVTDREFRKCHEPLRTIIDGLLDGLGFLSEWTCAHVDEIRVDDGVHEARLTVWRGLSPENQHVLLPEPLKRRRLYCIRIDDHDTASYALDLSPFFIPQDCGDCELPRIFVLDHITERSAHGAATSVRYDSSACSHVYVADDPSGDFARLKGFLSGQVELSEHFRGRVLGLAGAGAGSVSSSSARAWAREQLEVAKELQRAGRFHDSRAPLEDALSCDPDLGEAHLGLGLARLMEGEEAERILSYFRRASELSPQLAGAHLAIGLSAACSGSRSVALAHLQAACATDPANQRLQRILADVESGAISEDVSSDWRALVAREVLVTAEPLLPEMRPWQAALPPWRWIASRPALGSWTVAGGIFCILGLTHLDQMSPAWLARFATVSGIIGLGLWVPFLITSFARTLFRRLRSVVNLPVDAFRRWFLGEMLTVVGGYHDRQREGEYGLAALWSRERTNLLGYLAGLVVFGFFQVAMVRAADPPTGDLASWTRVVAYGAEILVGSWCAIFVLRSLQLIPRLRRLPFRHFVDMPNAVSLEPIGTFYLKVSIAGWAAVFLFTCQHYLYETHAHAPFLSAGFIVVVHGVLAAQMLASQVMIVMAMRSLRDRRLTEFAAHLELAFDRLMSDPTESNLNALERRREAMQLLHRRLRLSGLSRLTLAMLLILTLVASATLGTYCWLVSRGA